MNNQIKINFENSTIEITRGFEKKAKQYGSEEYNELMKVCEKHPNFKVVVKARSTSHKRKNRNKGLTYEFMENYINTHDNSDEAFGEYQKIRSNKDNPDKNENPYLLVKDWFLERYPAVKKFVA